MNHSKRQSAKQRQLKLETERNQKEQEQKERERKRREAEAKQDEDTESDSESESDNSSEEDYEDESEEDSSDEDNEPFEELNVLLSALNTFDRARKKLTATLLNQFGGDIVIITDFDKITDDWGELKERILSRYGITKHDIDKKRHRARDEREKEMERLKLQLDIHKSNKLKGSKDMQTELDRLNVKIAVIAYALNTASIGPKLTQKLLNYVKDKSNKIETVKDWDGCVKNGKLKKIAGVGTERVEALKNTELVFKCRLWTTYGYIRRNIQFAVCKQSDKSFIIPLYLIEQVMKYILLGKNIDFTAVYGTKIF